MSLRASISLTEPQEAYAPELVTQWSIVVAPHSFCGLSTLSFKVGVNIKNCRFLFCGVKLTAKRHIGIGTARLLNKVTHTGEWRPSVHNG